MGQSGTSIKNAWGHIDEMMLSKDWKTKFKMIYIAYYQNFYLGSIRNPLLWRVGPQIAELAPINRLKFDTRSNILALIFGPLYYILKGMVLKGIALLAIIIGLFIWQDGTKNFIPFVFLYCGFFADIDYFNSKFLKQTEIVNNPSLLSDYYDKFYVAKIAKRSPVIALLKSSAVILVLIWALFLAWKFYDSAQIMKYFNSVEKVCTDTQSCNTLIQNEKAKASAYPDKNHQNEYYKIGCAYYWDNQKKKALEYFSKSKVENPTNIKPYTASAIVYSELGSYKSTIQNYEAILKVDPEAILAYYYIGRTYYKTRNYSKALECFEKVTKKYPNEPIYLEAQAYTKIYLRDMDGAKEDIKQTIKLLEKQGKAKNAIKIDNLKKYIGVMR